MQYGNSIGIDKSLSESRIIILVTRQIVSIDQLNWILDRQKVLAGQGWLNTKQIRSSILRWIPSQM